MHEFDSHRGITGVAVGTLPVPSVPEESQPKHALANLSSIVNCLSQTVTYDHLDLHPRDLARWRSSVTRSRLNTKLPVFAHRMPTPSVQK